MRARNIKPGFFINCELSDVDFASRLLFIGLWCYADREGRFEWKPKQIKAAIFPYDNVNIDKLLCNLMSLHLITCHDKVGYVEHFKKHQRPHPHEAKSLLPKKPEENQCHDMSCNVTKCQADIMIEDIMIEDIMIEDIIIPDININDSKNKMDDFDIFWNTFAYKQGKGGAEKAWMSIKNYSDELTEKIIAGARREAARRPMLIKQNKTPKWAQGWITERRWEDEHADGLIPAETTEEEKAIAHKKYLEKLFRDSL